MIKKYAKRYRQYLRDNKIAQRIFLIGALSPLFVFAINIFIQTLLFVYPALEAVSLIKTFGHVFQKTALYIGSVLSWYGSLSTRSFAFSFGLAYRSHLKAEFIVALFTLIFLSILLGVIATAAYEALKWIRNSFKK